MTERAFSHMAECWYAKANLKPMHDRGNIDEVVFWIRYFDDNKLHEAVMEWRWIDNFDQETARLRIFDESFDLLVKLQDVWKELAAFPNLTPAIFCELLKSCGFEDQTERIRLK